jgi:hypothetical protein
VLKAAQIWVHYDRLLQNFDQDVNSAHKPPCPENAKGFPPIGTMPPGTKPPPEEPKPIPEDPFPLRHGG